MDRYAYYLKTCRLERRRPLGPDYFRLRYEELLRPYDATNASLHIDWSANIPGAERDLITTLVHKAHAQTADAVYQNPGRAVISLLHMLSKTLLTAGAAVMRPRDIPPDDRSEFGGSGPKSEPPDSAPGVREPLRPQSPLLSGSAARAYPPTEPPRWWAV